MKKEDKYTLIFWIGVGIVLLTPYIPDPLIQMIWGDTEEIYASRFCGIRFPELLPCIRTAGILIALYGLSNSLLIKYRKGNEHEKII